MRIPLNQGKFAIVDEEDNDLTRFKWFCQVYGSGTNKGFYAMRQKMIQGKRYHIYMHRVILERKLGHTLKPTDDTDHSNNDGLDNRRANLTITTTRENIRRQRIQSRPKSSRFKGVRWHKLGKKWTAYIKLGRMQKHLGCFVDEVDAAKAYDEAALQHFGEFAKTNLSGGKTNVRSKNA